MLAMTEENDLLWRSKGSQDALCTNRAQEHCGSTWDEVMETSAFFIMSFAINALVILVLLLS